MPIQGMIQNHVLAVRPTRDEDGNITVKLIDDCNEAEIKELLAMPGIERYAPPLLSLAEVSERVSIEIEDEETLLEALVECASLFKHSLGAAGAELRLIELIIAYPKLPITFWSHR